VAWRIDDDVASGRRSKMDLRRIDRDVLLLFFRERIEDKGVFELSAVAFTGGLKRFDFSFGQ
jgi:hypothetical protein